MKRREFMTLLGGAAIGWPVVARAQQTNRIRTVGVLMPFSENDPEGQRRLSAFVESLQQLGWIVGGNVRLDTRWASGDAEKYRKYSAELVSLSPSVIMGAGSAAAGPLLRATRTVPIVFTQVIDPVGAGFVDSLARPGVNATGFIQFEYGISGKWLELLKQIAPQTTRAAVIRDANVASGSGQLGAIQSAAPSFGVEVSPINLRSGSEIERAISAFADGRNGGLIVTGSARAGVYRDLIIKLSAEHKLPAIYTNRSFIDAGGLVSYGPNLVDQFRLAANYVDRVLKGDKPADLPVQAPTKYELVINLKTARALGISVPPTLLARADEVIE